MNIKLQGLLIFLLFSVGATSVSIILSRFEKKGADEARQEIQLKDMDAGDAANSARGDLRRCLDAGGMQYDFATRKCSK